MNDIYKETIIDLTKNSYSDATALPEKELVHIKQLNEINNLFKAQYDNIDTKDGNNDCCNNTISVFAKRGYGKTTFIKSFIHEINKNNYYNCCCLDIIDPSMLELKQHPFMHVLSIIHEKVEEYNNNNNNIKDPINERYESFISWNRAYKNLCKSLSVLDCVGESNFYKDWDDDVHIAKNGMKRAEAANNIRSYFKKYIDTSLILLNRRCFVLSFDDIDTNFSKGFDILESIRKYLTINKIITILTGDLSLYSKLIRQNLWTGFNSEYFNNEQKYSPNSMNEVSEIINQLEEQYLLKILKPENRITLDSIYEKIKNGQCNIEVKRNIDQECEDINKVYEQVSSKLGYSSTFPKIGVMTNFIMKLPIRTQMRILALINEEDDNPDNFVRGMIRIFRSDISLKSNLTEIDFANFDNFGLILDFFQKTNCLSRDISFLPETGDPTLDKPLFAIGGIINQKINKNIYLSFDYWIRVSYVRRSFDMANIPQMISYSEIDNDNSLNKSYCLSHAFHRSCEYSMEDAIMKPKVLPGVSEIDDYSNFAKEFNQNSIVGLALFETVSPSEKSTCFMSIYKLLASIGDLIKNYNEENDNRILLSLNTLSQFRSYLEPNKNVPEFRKDALEKRTIYDNFIFINFKEEFSKIEKWLYRNKKIHNSNQVSAYVLDRIFTRSYFSFSDIEKIKFHNAGEKLSYQIIAFLNAILVEESIDRGISNINLNSRSNTIEVFFNNLKITTRRNRLTFFSVMVSCPLLIDFIDPYYKNLIDKLENFNEDINVNDAVKYRILQNSIAFRKDAIESIDDKSQKSQNKALSYYQILEKIREYQLSKQNITRTKINNTHEFKPLESVKSDIINNIIEVEQDEKITFDKLFDNIKNVDNENSFTTYQNLYYTYLIKSLSLEKDKKDEKTMLEKEYDEFKKIEKSAFIGKIYETKEKSVYNTLCNIKLT